MDTALPGKHTKLPCEGFKPTGASLLAQLHTGMSHLHGYLHQIQISETDQCPCGQAKETVKHFLFRCTQWARQRQRLFRQTDTKRSNLSFFLVGREPSPCGRHQTYQQ